MSLKLMGTVLLRIHPFLVNFRRALQFVWESGPRLASASIALRVVQGLLPLVTLCLIKLMVDAVAEGLRSPSAELRTTRMATQIQAQNRHKQLERKRTF